MDAYVKTSRSIPDRYLPWEAAGLRWLRAVPGGAGVVEVLHVDATRLELRRLTPVAPSATAARDFGERLAVTHDAGAPAFGAGPTGWVGDGFLGPFSEPLPLQLQPVHAWGAFWADQRIAPMLAEGRRRGVYRQADAEVFQELMSQLHTGRYDTGEPPARLHGDLWSGNLLWTGDGAVLIDPAAHGGHHETDLAMLALFGAPFLSEILAGYQQTRPLAQGWQHRVALHQVHPLMVHAVLFRGGYVAQSVAAARRYVGPQSAPH